MVSRLQEEIKQSRPFKNLRHEVLLSVARTAALLTHTVEQALKPSGVTPTQFNVLRILRGAGADGLCRYEIAERLITPVPDVSRLLDRMVTSGLLTRRRTSLDRRVVVATITAKGLALLEELDETVSAVTSTLMPHISDDQLLSLRDLLDQAREMD